MIQFSNVSLHRGTHLVFDGLDLLLHASTRTGVVGPNGAGKSSLLSLILGQLEPDRGDVSVPRERVIAHLEQEIRSDSTRLLDFVIAGDARVGAAREQLHRAEAAQDAQAQAQAHARLDELGAYDAEARAARVLRGLGFALGDEQRRFDELSGGWRVRASLARALMCPSDILLLDEPTNHLDLDAVIWLESWLVRYPGTLVVISHDREFLDPVVNQIVRVEAHGARRYTGNYSDYEQHRAQELSQQQAASEKQRRVRSHMQAYVDRFRYKASKARQAQSRLKALARLEAIAPAHVDSGFDFRFEEPERLPRPTLTMEGVGVGYAGSPVLEDMKLSLEPGTRIGLLGANGAGKSTLIKLLAGELAPATGRLEYSPHIRIGYFAQHQLEQLSPTLSPLDHVRRAEPTMREQSMRDFLGGFGFGGEMASRLVAPFSGGEKARLALALVVLSRPNLLLLDEPTNHLDLEMRHALGVALQSFAGAIVLVSHDRHLLRIAADSLWLVADRGVGEFDDDIDAYARWLLASRDVRDDSAASITSSVRAPSSRDRRRDEAERRRQLRPFRAAVEKAEAELSRLGAVRSSLEAELADERIYEDAHRARLRELLEERGRVEKLIATAEAHWIDSVERLECVAED